MKLGHQDLKKLRFIGEAGDIVEAILGRDEFRTWWRKTMVEDWNLDFEKMESKLFELTGTRDPKKVDLSALGINSK
ncbi:MAG: hypothetical protein KJ042_09515 [Deltaproteobacteria bacterium]|nr:hypothetical protein [Deltaproteobacteria bacterium]